MGHQCLHHPITADTLQQRGAMLTSTPGSTAPACGHTVGLRISGYNVTEASGREGVVVGLLSSSLHLPWYLLHILDTVLGATANLHI